MTAFLVKPPRPREHALWAAALQRVSTLTPALLPQLSLSVRSSPPSELLSLLLFLSHNVFSANQPMSWTRFTPLYKPSEVPKLLLPLAYKAVYDQGPCPEAGLLWSLIPFTNYPPPTQASSGLCTGSSLCIECSYSRSSHGWLSSHHLGLRSPGSPPQRLCLNTIYRRTPRLFCLKLAFVVVRKTKKQLAVI